MITLDETRRPRRRLTPAERATYTHERMMVAQAQAERLCRMAAWMEASMWETRPPSDLAITLAAWAIEAQAVSDGYRLMAMLENGTRGMP